jgi:PAS domain S-box-containing protein
MWHRLIPRISRSASQPFLAIIALAGLTVVCFRLQLNISTVGFLYLIVIVLLSLAGDYVASVVTSVVAAVCLAYFFAPPIFSIRVDDPLNIVAIVAFLTTSLVISRLVSEVRTRSEKLRLNEYYLSEGQRLAHMGSWAFCAAGFDYWSSELFRIHGLDPRGKPPSVEEYLALVHPEDRAFMQQGITHMLAGHRAFDFTKRIVRSDGEIRHMRCVGVPVTQGGLFQGFLGTEMDVTEQEQLTEELRRSEKELRDVIDTIPAAVWSALPDGSNTYVNRRFIEFSGMSVEQTAGSGWKAAIHPDDLERHAGKWMEAVATGKPHENEVRFRRSDGQYRWHLDRGVPLRDEDGNIVKWYSVATDIEDRKRAEEALHDSEKSFRLVIDGIAGLVAIMTAEGEVEFVNSHILEYFGKTLEEFKGWSTSDAVHPDDLPYAVAAWRHSVETGDPYDVDHRLRRFDGAYRWFHSRGLSLRDAEGRIVRWYNLLTDIDERKRWEEKLRRSEAYLAEAERLSHTGSFGWKPDTGAIVWSDESYRIFEYNPAEKFTLDTIMERVHPEDRHLALEVVEQASKSGDVADFKLRLLFPEGRVKYIRVLVRPLGIANDDREFAGAVVDRTEAHLAEERIRQDEAELRLLIDAIPQQVAVFGSDWTPLFANRQAQEYTGLSPQEVQSIAAIDSLIHPDDLGRLHGNRERARRESLPVETEARIRGKEGIYRWFLLRAYPLQDSQGRVLRWYATRTDITELKSAEQERERLRQLEADLAHINRVSTLGEMAASISHELAQPIQITTAHAKASLRWLQRDPPDLKEVRKGTERIIEAGTLASEIINRLRSLYKKSAPQRELVDVNGIIQEMLTLLEGEAFRLSVAMRTDFSAELPQIMVDRVQLQQVFMNLMLNAIEAMKDAGGDLTVKSELQNSQLQLSVSDTGVGLPMEKMDQIFCAFFTTKPQGSGMGLAISRSIVESHGGQLWASANEGGGATFHFTLPVQATESSPLVA